MKDLIKEKQEKKREKQLEQREELKKWFVVFRDGMLEWTGVKK